LVRDTGTKQKAQHYYIAGYGHGISSPSLVTKITALPSLHDSVSN